MKFKRVQLGIKIGSLADEARRIRSKETSLIDNAAYARDAIVATHKGLTPGSDMPPDLLAHVKARLERPLKGVPPLSSRAFRIIDRIGRKAVKRYLRKGMTREEILALPGMVQTFRHYPLYAELRSHRKGPVRHEARHAQLALGFLRQRPYERCEDKASNYPCWDKVAEIAKRFSLEDKRDVMQKFEQWSQEATAFIRNRENETLSQFPKEPFYVN